MADDEWNDESFYDDNEAYQKQRRTLPEALDAAQNGTEFGLAIMDMFAALDRARFKEEEAEDGDGDR